MSAKESNAYDEVLYPGHALAQAHPDRLATLATLFGVSAPPVGSARVLELACGDGLNLISVAQGLPSAECLGLDLAAAGILRGQEIIQRLGLKNVHLRQADLCDVKPDLGRFDYIIAHGLYSWVPREVRDKLLEVCRANLSDNGVAYISYNTYPGCHLRQMMRGMMKFHVQHRESAREKVVQARALIGFLGQQCSRDPDFYRAVLEREFERLSECLDSSVYHDDLADTNVPVYFHEFVEHAAEHRLQYLSEAQFFEMQSGLFSLESVEVLNQIADTRIAKEQYLDFLKCRSFRQTLLVHAEQELDFRVDAPGRLASFFIASPLALDRSTTGEAAGQPVTFLGPKNSSLKTDSPVVKAALAFLGNSWPRAISFAELLAEARAATLVSGKNDSSDAEDARVLSETLLRAYAGGLVELSVYPPRFAVQAGERPLASGLARLQAAEGRRLINLRHHNIEVPDAFHLELLKLLDGTRDRKELIAQLNAQTSDGQYLVAGEREAATRDEIETTPEGRLEHSLTSLVRMALMEA